MMKPELFHRWYCPYSAKVRDFIQENHLEEQVDYVEVDEDDLGTSRLIRFTGNEETPALIADGRVIQDPGEIIDWMEVHLLGRGDTAIT